METPILQPIYGGAAARPFTTYHNQLKQELYLRISFELYLKRLLVGNLERVYEIGRDFRNEGVDRTHNPEFTQLEFYWAYADYLQVMELTEQMVAFAADQVLGSQRLTYQGQEIDLQPPWRRLELREGLLQATGIDISLHPTAASLSEAMHSKGMQFNPNATRGKLVETLLDDHLQPTLIQPTFVYNYPRDISPLAKSLPGDPQTVERFEGFLAGMELCNAFTELNDPLDQESRFLEMGRDYAAGRRRTPPHGRGLPARHALRHMGRDYAAGDEERHPMDEDYLPAPCATACRLTAALGWEFDRLVMLMADVPNIREVILFPHLRSEH